MQASPDRLRTRHPLWGALFGLLLGVGVALLVVVYGWVPFSSWLEMLAFVIGITAFGILVGVFAPIRRPSW